MLKILIPVDGSDNASRVVDYTIKLVAQSKQAEIHLITVRDPMDTLGVQRFWTDEQLHTFNQETGNLALQAGRKLLEDAGIPYIPNIVIGEIAQTIAEYAKEQRCDMIIMGTRGMGTIGSLLMGSVATKVVHLASVPVTLVK